MVEVRLDDRLRLLSAMLLFTAQGSHQTHFAPHPIRIRTLEWLAPHSGHSSLRIFRRLAERVFISFFYSLGVQLGAAPDFAPPDEAVLEPDIMTHLERVAKDSGCSSTYLLNELSESMGDFYSAGRLPALWSATSAAWDSVRAGAVRAVDSCGLATWLKSFFGPVNFRLVVVPLATSPPSMGFGPRNSSEGYAIIGPNCVSRPGSEAGLWQGLVRGRGEVVASKTSKTWVEEPFDYALSFDASTQTMMVHEFSHSLIREFFGRNPDLAHVTSAINAKLPLRGYFPNMYPEWPLRLEEIIVRAVQTLFQSDHGGEAAGRRALEAQVSEFGLEVLPEVHRALADYARAKKAGDYGNLSEFGPELEKRLLAWAEKS